MHGELAVIGCRFGVSAGSSPRAWGTPVLRGLFEGVFRFIPTCMGNSWTALKPARPCSVHPHVHGELNAKVFRAMFWLGSSPRAWGTHHRRPAHAPGTRFIPTCMGNSSYAWTPSSELPVHPHVHGELQSW